MHVSSWVTILIHVKLLQNIKCNKIKYTCCIICKSKKHLIIQDNYCKIVLL